MPSLHDVAHDGFLCTFRNKSVLIRGKWFGPSGQAVWITHHVQNHTPCWVTLLQPARRAAVSGQPSSLWPHCSPWSIHSGAQTREFLDCRWLLSGVHSIMMAKSAQPVAGGGYPLPRSLYLPSQAKLWCTVQLRGQIHSLYFSSTPIHTQWF
jgi:hypothetical protein